MHRATVVRGVGGVGAAGRNPAPKGEAEAENVMRSAPHPKADPKSSMYVEGTRCFRTRNPGLGLLLYVKRPRQIGDTVLPGEHENIRFQPMTAAGDCGELVTNRPDVIARILEHRWYADGTIVDAVEAFAEARLNRAKEIVSAIKADPLLKADFESLLGASTVGNFLDAVEKTDVKPAKPSKSRRTH